MDELLAGAHRLLRSIKGGGSVPDAFGKRQQLISPRIRVSDVAFQNLRARLAQADTARQNRFLRLVLFRARARLDVDLLRSVSDLAPDRSTAVKLTFSAARHDKTFRAMAAKGDKARDRRNWQAGADAYAAALRLFPRHHGYLVQFAHCCKEQERYALAEIAYRDALALGAAMEDVWEHLEHVVLRGGGSARVYPPDIVAALASSDQREVAALATSAELESLLWLLHGKKSTDPASLVRLLRLAPRRVELLAHLIADPAFLRANRQLVAYSGRGTTP